MRINLDGLDFNMTVKGSASSMGLACELESKLVGRSWAGAAGSSSSQRAAGRVQKVQGKRYVGCTYARFLGCK